MKHTFELCGYSIETEYPMDKDEICFVLFEKDLDEVNEMRYDLCEYLQDDMREFFKQNELQNG